ncbi:hypothetical protein VTL71DRAFT_9999 [Oculimacula yallundae]|uniref:Zn(2)-C6 fungal-type domain-containing protein n=1 Tax=Oculimacula yallundae TaxID=86028 RepID=A0ABR4BQ12_9HELO
MWTPFSNFRETTIIGASIRGSDMSEHVVVQKKKRRGGKKSSMGCRTCKQRRVKCDEARPTCLRCSNFGIRCDGYTRPVPAFTSAVMTRPLLPNPKPLCKPPVTVSKLFATDQEYNYFRRFCEESAKQLTGYRESSFWSRLVLQTSEVEPCVRHAVIAIGALDFRRKGGGNSSRHGSTSGSEPESEEIQTRDLANSDRTRLEFAYREYAKAISLLKSTIARKETMSMQTSLVTSLLLICFESYHGNSDLAAAHVYAAIEMMETYTREREGPGRKKDPLASSRKGWKKEITTPIDDEIVDMFSMLEIQASSWSDTRSPSLHQERMLRCEVAASFMPSEFSTVQEATRVMYQVMLRGVHLQLPFESVTFLKGLDMDLSTRPGPLACEPKYLDLYSTLGTFQQWGRAYAPLLRRARSENLGKDTLRAATMLHVQYLAGYLRISASSPRLDMYYRKYTNELQELVECCKMLGAENEEEDYFSLDFRVVLPLQVVVWNYHHRALRREVLDIFRRCPRREGMWDTRTIVAIVEWVASVEELGLGDEIYVPEDRLVTIVAIKIFPESRSAYLKGLQVLDGNMVFSETTVSW